MVKNPYHFLKKVVNANTNPPHKSKRIFLETLNHSKNIKLNKQGDNNQVDDRALYNRGQLWIEPKDIVGRAGGMAPYVGMVTIIMNDYPKIKWAVLAVLTALTLLNREAQSYL